MSGGKIDLIAFASIVLPDQGGPAINTLCIPAAATVRALLGTRCHLISAKSTSNDEKLLRGNS